MTRKGAIKNLTILLIAPLLAGVLFYTTRDMSEWTASVLDVLELEHIEQEGWGAAYKTHSHTIEIFGSKEAQKADTLLLELLYNADQLILDMSHLPSYAQLQHQHKGSVQLLLQGLDQLKLEEWWIELPFSGEAKDILLAKAIARSSWAAKALKVWNLNTFTPLHQN